MLLTFANIAAADAYGDQQQGASVTVTKDGVSGALGGTQKSVTNDGTVKQVQTEKVKTKLDKDGDVKSVTVKLVEKEKIKSTSSSSDDSGVDSVQYQNSNVMNDGDSTQINVNQGETGLVVGSGTLKQKQVTVTKVKFTDDGTFTTTKMQESVKAK